MAAITFDLVGEYVIEQGADYRLPFRIFDVLPEGVSTSEGTIYTGGVPTDLTGLSFRCQFRAPNAAGAVQANAPDSLFEREARGDDLWVVMHLPHTLTAAMTAPRGVYNIEVVDNESGEVMRLMEGEWALSFDATRPEETP